MPHARGLPFGWPPVAQASLVVVFRLVGPHVGEHVLAHERMHVAFRMAVWCRGGLRERPAVPAAGLGVPFALAFDPVDGPIVGDPVPVVGQTTRGVDATEPVRVRW